MSGPARRQVFGVVTHPLLDQKLSVLPDQEVGVALSVGVEIPTTEEQPERVQVRRRRGLGEGSADRIGAGPGVAGVPEDGGGTGGHVEPGAHRPEAEIVDIAARAVEAHYYPDLLEPRHQPLREPIWLAVKLAFIAVILNLLVLPIYLIPVLNIFVFYALNGYLLGREYFELAALRRIDEPDARQLRRRHRIRVFVVGVIITFLLSIPFVNWFMPVVAAAFVVHMFEGLRARAGIA